MQVLSVILATVALFWLRIPHAVLPASSAGVTALESRVHFAGGSGPPRPSRHPWPAGCLTRSARVRSWLTGFANLVVEIPGSLPRRGAYHPFSYIVFLLALRGCGGGADAADLLCDRIEAASRSICCRAASSLLNSTPFCGPGSGSGRPWRPSWLARSFAGLSRRPRINAR